MPELAYNHQQYANNLAATQAAERKASDVECEIAVLNKNAEALSLCVEQLEKRLTCVLPVQVTGASNPKGPEAVVVPLAAMLRGPNDRLHDSITRLNDIIARIELPS